MKISILIPVYNASQYLEEAINSCIDQTLKPTEIILLNDGSTDASWDIMMRMAKQHPIVKIYQQENTGPSIARNRLVDFASQDWICFMDSDDVLHPMRLEAASKFTLDCDAVICGFNRFENKISNFEAIEISNIKVSSLKDSQRMVLKYGYGLPRMLMKRGVYLDANGLDSTLVNNEDHELHFRMLTQNVKFKYIDANLYFYRQHQGEFRLSNQVDKTKHICNALDKMSNQIDALPIDLQSFAKVQIGNRMAHNALKQARLGHANYKNQLHKAKQINPNIRPYNKAYLNTLSSLFGYGNLEKVLSYFV